MKFNKLIPELYVSNFKESLSFYKRLGFKIEYEREENNFAFLSFEGSQIMIQQEENSWKTGKLEYPYGRGINIQIEIKDLNKIISQLDQKYIFLNIKENTYRKGEDLIVCKELLVQDPDGYLLRFSQIITK